VKEGSSSSKHKKKDAKKGWIMKYRAIKYFKICAQELRIERTMVIWWHQWL
jgi:hypothetical protein